MFLILGVMRQQQPQEILVFHMPHNGDVHMNYAFLVFHYQPAGKVEKLILTEFPPLSDHNVHEDLRVLNAQSIAGTEEDESG